MKRLLPILLLVFSVGIGVQTVEIYGGTYTGELVNDVPNGQGIWTHPDGRKYVGQYQDGKANGYGTFTSATGLKYVGQWKDNQWSELRAMTDPDRGLTENEKMIQALRWCGTGLAPVTVVYPQGPFFLRPPQ